MKLQNPRLLGEQSVIGVCANAGRAERHGAPPRRPPYSRKLRDKEIVRGSANGCSCEYAGSRGVGFEPMSPRRATPRPGILFPNLLAGNYTTGLLLEDPV